MKDQLVSAATTLLDKGGQDAVTLRAVAKLAGVSHNAHYRHFRDRSGLLAAVAIQDFIYLRDSFGRVMHEEQDAATALRRATTVLIDYGLKYPFRYRLLFSDPGLTPEPGLRDAALASFEAYNALVEQCQDRSVFAKVATVSLTGLIYACLHGAIDLALSGRASGSKGLGSIEATADLLFRLLEGAPVQDG